MARTQRRRAAHDAGEEAAHASATLGRAKAASLLKQEEWASLSETLDGLLRLEFPSPFTDLELLCPKEAWLVVDLSRVRASAGIAPNLRLQIVRVLDCLGRLLVHAEMLRPWRELLEAFWRRVLLSEMLRDVENDEAKVSGFIRYVRAKGSHVALQWRGRSLEPTHLIEPLRKWLETEIDTLDHPYTPVLIGLRFEDCQLTSKNLKEIQKLLKAPVPGDKKYLCDPSVLRELSLSSNILPIHVLHELAEILEYSSARRIDGLRLDRTVPPQAQQPPTYGPALGRVLTAVVSPKTDVTAVDPGVSLSLEDSTIYHFTHIDALRTALTSATRPLRYLSLACWHFPERRLLHRFGRLLLTPLPTATDVFDLNLSCIRGPPDAFEVHQTLEGAREEYIREAVADGKAVSIRPGMMSDFYAEGHELETKLSGVDFYEVRGVADHGCCLTAVPINGREVVGHVEQVEIAKVRIADDAYEPKGLILDGCKRHQGCSTVPPVVANCDQLKRLSVRNKRWDQYQFDSWCSALEELNAEGCDQNQEQLSCDLSLVAESLQVVNLSKCSLEVPTLETLLAFPKLRHLGFAHNKVAERPRQHYASDEPPPHPGLEALRDALFNCDNLDHVDIRNCGFDADDESHNAIGTQITTRLQYERLSYDARRAFLVALRHVDIKLSRDTVETILSFARVGERRDVLW